MHEALLRIRNPSMYMMVLCVTRMSRIIVSQNLRKDHIIVEFSTKTILSNQVERELENDRRVSETVEKEFHFTSAVKKERSTHRLTRL